MKQVGLVSRRCRLCLVFPASMAQFLSQVIHAKLSFHNEAVVFIMSRHCLLKAPVGSNQSARMTDPHPFTYLYSVNVYIHKIRLSSIWVMVIRKWGVILLSVGNWFFYWQISGNFAAVVVSYINILHYYQVGYSTYLLQVFMNTNTHNISKTNIGPYIECPNLHLLRNHFVVHKY